MPSARPWVIRPPNSKPFLRRPSSISGKWYEVARYPNRFEKACVADVTAQYTLRDDGTIEVLNSCRQPDGKMKSSKGSAKVADTQSNASSGYLLLALLR